MCPSDTRSKLVYHNDTFYEGWIDSGFILVHKGLLIIKQGCTRDNEEGL